MSTLDGARERLEQALQQLETALRNGARLVPPPAESAAASTDHAPSYAPVAGPSENEAMLARDLELLRAECDGLRRSLDEALNRNRALAETVGEVTGKLDRTIGELAYIVEG